MPRLEAPPVIADESEQARCEDEQTGRAHDRNRRYRRGVLLTACEGSIAYLGAGALERPVVDPRKIELAQDLKNA